MKKIIPLLLLFIMTTGHLCATWIVKIGDDVVTKEEFENYIYINQKPQNYDKETYLSEALNNFINERIFINLAKKNGITKDHPDIKKTFKRVKDSYLLQFYLSEKMAKETDIDQNKIVSQVQKSMSVSDLKNFYNQLKPSLQQNTSQTLPEYGNLNQTQKQQIQQEYVKYKAQEIYMPKVEEFKNKLRRDLEQKIKVKIYNDHKTLTAKVGDYEITKKDINKMITMVIRQNGQEMSDNLYNDILNEMIFEYLIKVHFENLNYEDTKSGQIVINLIYNQLIAEKYKERIAYKCKPSEKEVDRFLQENLESFQNSRQIMQIKNYLGQKMLEEKLSANTDISQEKARKIQNNIIKSLQGESLNYEQKIMFAEYKLQEDALQSRLPELIQNERDRVIIKKNKKILNSIKL